MRGWYIDAANRHPTPAQVYLETLTEERTVIYAHVPPPGRPITIEVPHLPVDDNTPEDEDIYEAVLQMQLHFSGGPSHMRSKHLMMWLCAEIQEEYPDLGNWDKVISIIHAASREREIMASCAW